MVATEAPPAGTREWLGLGLLSVPTVLLGLDVTVLYLALPSMAADLAPSPAQTLWIMDVYGFLIAGFLITMGTLGDRTGRRRLLMIGVSAFAAASLFAAFAPSAEALIAARALLGIAGATLMPSTLSLIGTMFTDVHQRAVAIGVWVTMFAVGMAAGPVVGGLLVDLFWWGAAFLLAVPAAAVVLVAAPRLLPEYSAPTGQRLDLASVLLSLAAILPVVYAVKHIAANGFDLSTAALFLAGAVAGTVFARRQRRLDAPLVDVGLFADKGFSAALAVLLVGLVGVGGAMYLVTQYLQTVEGLSPAAAGLWMGPPALTMIVAAVGAPILARRVRPAVVIAAALAVSVAGYLLIAGADLGGKAFVVAGFALVYLGLGGIAALGTDIVVGAAPAEKSGSAAALSETVQEFGIAAGVALLGSLTTAIRLGRSPETPAEENAAFTAGLMASSLTAAVATAAVAVLCMTTLKHLRPIGAD
ncbi:MFS transporter [Salininema proteolyticum]|uniref:MFS transporter n=1 Tax=Salininema proteolyticum TaxID=1607685 RepID=A0ABV8TWZ3_9ACTN